MVEQFKEAKFLQALHYFIHNCGHLQNFGKTLLYKMLYFSDFDFYEEFENFLTGETYFKLPRGPAPSHFDEVIEILKKEEKICVKKVDYCGHTQIRFLSMGKPALDLLNAQEIQVLDRTIEKLGSMTAKQVSAYSHEDMPWKSAEDNQALDYEQVFYRNELMSVREC